MIELIDEIGIEYANDNGGGLPLTAKEYCNALALWVQQKLESGSSGEEPKKYIHKIECYETTYFNDDYGYALTFVYIDNNPNKYGHSTFPWDKLMFGTNVFLRYAPYGTTSSEEDYNGFITRAGILTEGSNARIEFVCPKGSVTVTISKSVYDTVTEI